jgi:hypothetical protein
MAEAFPGAARRVRPGFGGSVCVMEDLQHRPQATPEAGTERERRERALDQALDQSFPASDTPAMLRPHRRPAPDGASR